MSNERIDNVSHNYYSIEKLNDCKLILCFGNLDLFHYVPYPVEQWALDGYINLVAIFKIKYK